MFLFVSLCLINILFNQKGVCGQYSPSLPEDVDGKLKEMVHFTQEAYNLTRNIRKPRNTVVQDCLHTGRTLTQSRGSIASPNFPNKYDNNLLCYWVIQNTLGYTLDISFTSFSLEENRFCAADGLEIYVGESDSGSLFGKFCGNKLPPTIQSNADKVYIYFKTDHSVTDSGFKLDFKSECICGKGHRCMVANGKKVCVCTDKYQDNNGTCEECDCGSGHSCKFQVGRKTCICVNNHADNGGTCEECLCGGNYSCIFAEGKKSCLCPENYVESDGKCKECFCGDGNSCEIIVGKKVCVCKYQDNSGTCEECSCGGNYSCIVENGKKTCLSPEHYVQHDKCKDLHVWNSLISTVSVIFFFCLILLAIYIIRYKTRLPGSRKAEFNCRDDDVSIMDLIPEEKTSNIQYKANLL